MANSLKKQTQGDAMNLPPGIDRLTLEDGTPSLSSAYSEYLTKVSGLIKELKDLPLPEKVQASVRLYEEFIAVYSQNHFNEKNDEPN